MKGRVHSIQSLGAVDGPGVRYVVFLQGCPLRCAYCHNPDTWDFSGGQEREAAELVQEICRYKMYFGDKGGVTVSGGNPCCSPPLWGAVPAAPRGGHPHGIGHLRRVGRLGRRLPGAGPHGFDFGRLEIRHTGRVPAPLQGGHGKAPGLLPAGGGAGHPLWVRHVVVPGLNDSLEDMGKIKVLAESFSNLEKIEWLPFHNLCVEKYQSMGIPFPLAGTDNMDEEALQRLVEQLNAEGA